MKYNIKTATNRAARVLKAAAKRAAYPALLYAYTDKDGRQIVSDSFRIYRFKEQLDLAKLPDDMLYPNMQKLFVPYEHGKTIGVTAPEISVLKSVIKAHGGKENAIYSFGDGFPSVKAQFLLEVLETFPDAELYVAEENRLIKPIYAVSKHGDAMIAPFRWASVPEQSEQQPEPAEEEIETLTPDEFAERYACAA